MGGDITAVEGSCVPSTTLLNLGNVELQEAVQPLNEFLSIAGMVISLGASRWRGGGGQGRSRPRPQHIGARWARGGRPSRLTVIHPWLFTESRSDKAAGEQTKQGKEGRDG